jgi:hypothetical protein
MPRAHCLVRKDAPDRQLHVRYRVGDDHRAALGNNVEVARFHPHRMREHRARGEEPEAVEVRTGRLTRTFEQPGDLVLDLQEMDVHRQCSCVGLLGDPAQRRFAHRVEAVWRERRSHQRPEVGELVDRSQRVGAQLTAAGRIETVDERQPNRRAHPRILDGARHRARSPVHVPEPHRS